MLSTGERFDCVTIPDPRGPFLFFFLPRRAVDGILPGTSRQQSVIPLRDPLFPGRKLTTTKTLKKSCTCKVARRVGSSQQTPFSIANQAPQFRKGSLLLLPCGHLPIFGKRVSKKNLHSSLCTHLDLSLQNLSTDSIAAASNKRGQRRKIKIAI